MRSGARTWALLAVAGVAVAVVVSLPYQVDAFQLGVVTLAMTLSLLAMGVNLMAGSAGLVSMGHAGIMAAGGYGLAIVQTRTEASLPLQLAAGMAVALLVALVFGLMSMRTNGIYFFMATVAQGLIVWGVAMRFTSLTHGETGIRGVERPGFIEQDWQLYYAAAVIVALALGAYYVVTRSPFGVILRAMSGSPSRLAMLGYDVRIYKVYVFVVSGAFAGGAGILYVYYNRFISPDAADFLTSGKALLMVLVGGAGFLLGPLLGALLITGVENFLGTMTDRWPTILGLMYVLVVLFARNGLIERFGQVWGRGRAIMHRPAQLDRRPPSMSVQEDTRDPSRPSGDNPTRSSL